MKVYFVNGRKLVKFLLGLTVIILFMFSLLMEFNITDKGIVDVFSDKRELPIYSVESKQKVAAITFDCAWGADDIPDILNTLKNENIKATFFVLGQWAEKFPDKVKMISKEGHDIANHSQSHLRMGTIDKNKIKSEIELCGKKLEEISGNKVDLFRPPYGDYNDTVINTAKELGYFTIQWDVDSLDWKPGISQPEIMNRIRKKISPGSIILFHNDTVHTAKMLPDVINCLKDEGYSFLPVSKLILRQKYKIDYDGRQKPE